MESIVSKNLEIMASNEKGGMFNVLNNESIGGNAGIHGNKYPCAGANFSYDKRDGKLIYFGNIQHVPKNIAIKYSRHCFRVAMDIFNSKMHIVDFKAPDEASEKAKKTLEETVKEFNKKYGFTDLD